MRRFGFIARIAAAISAPAAIRAMPTTVPMTETYLSGGLGRMSTGTLSMRVDASIMPDAFEMLEENAIRIARIQDARMPSVWPSEVASVINADIELEDEGYGAAVLIR